MGASFVFVTFLSTQSSDLHRLFDIWGVCIKESAICPWVLVDRKDITVIHSVGVL